MADINSSLPVRTQTAGDIANNTAQINGVTVSMGSGVMGTGVQRVAIASDNDALSVKQATAANLNAAVVGTKTNNNAVPGATNVGALPAVANAAAPTQTEGNMVALRTNLAGDVAITLDSEAVVLGAGSALVGKVGIDQTTPGTTNAVSLAQIGATTVSTGNGVAGAGVQRVTIASDNSPIPVTFSSAQITNEVHDYNTSAALAAAGTSNHDYTVGNTALLLKGIYFSASGKMKVELKVGPVASLVSKYVGFISTASPSGFMPFPQPIEVPSASTGTVRIIRTNLESSAMDVYSAINGNEV